MDSPLHLVLIDDRPDNQAAWIAALQSICTTTDTLTVLDSVGAGTTWLRDLSNMADAVFLDFFLGDGYGTQIIDSIRQGRQPRPLIIAHSSHEAANTAMIDHGADVALAKIKGQHPSPTVANTFARRSDLVDFLARHRQPYC